MGNRSRPDVTPSYSRLPTEVELVYEVMPCNAMRVAQEPLGKAHPCTYFRRWGTYHSYDYSTVTTIPRRGPPPNEVSSRTPSMSDGPRSCPSSCPAAGRRRS